MEERSHPRFIIGRHYRDGDIKVLGEAWNIEELSSKVKALMEEGEDPSGILLFRPLEGVSISPYGGIAFEPDLD